MTVYVDEPIFSWRNMKWCHLFSDNLDELHAFAAQLGLKREWFQNPDTMPKVSWPHYDTIASKRLIAIRKGAIAVDRYKCLEIAAILMGYELAPQKLLNIAAIREREGNHPDGRLK